MPKWWEMEIASWREEIQRMQDPDLSITEGHFSDFQSILMNVVIQKLVLFSPCRTLALWNVSLLLKQFQEISLLILLASGTTWLFDRKVCLTWKYTLRYIFLQTVTPIRFHPLHPTSTAHLRTIVQRCNL